MKKIVATILVLVFSLSLSACVKGLFTGSEGYEKVFDLKNYNEVRTEQALRQRDGTLEVTQDLMSALPGHLNTVLIAGVENFSVDRGYFSLNITMSIVGVSQNSEMIGELQIFDTSDGNLIGYRSVHRFDFKADGLTEELSAVFVLPKKTKVDLMFYSTNKTPMKITKFSLTSTEPENYLVDDISAYLKAEEDDSISYSEDTLYYFDLYRYTEILHDTVFGYDIGNIVVALQGIVNRDGNHIAINSLAPINGYSDKYWLKEMQKEGNYLSGTEVVEVKSPATLLRLFKDKFNGLVEWDPNVPATSNVAFTMAGIENVLPVRYSASKDSLYYVLTQEYGLNVAFSLVGKFTGEGKIWQTNLSSSGSAKNDAYLWAKDKYIDTSDPAKRVNPTLVSVYIDAFTFDRTGKIMTYYDYQGKQTANRDYFVMNRAFFMDLSIWPDYLPNDDPDQPLGTDYATLEKIMTKLNQLADGELITVGGFVPWAMKYSGYLVEGAPKDVANEIQSLKFYSQFYAIVDADAYPPYGTISNTSIYCKFEGEEEYTQTAAIDDASVDARAAKYIDANGKVIPNTYVVVYMGDYDSASWTAGFMPAAWNDPARGKLPLAWPITPVVSTLIPHVYDKMYKTATENDYFVGGNNGYGYNNIESLLNSSRPQYLKGTFDDYMELVDSAWDKFDLNIFGWYIFYEDPITQADYDRGVRGFRQKAHFDIIKRFIVDLDLKGIGNHVPNSDMIKAIRFTENGKEYNVPYVGQFQNWEWANWEKGVTDFFGGSVNNPTSEANFIYTRSVLKTPSYIDYTFKKAQSMYPEKKLVMVDPYVFFKLYSIQNQESFVFDENHVFEG